MSEYTQKSRAEVTLKGIVQGVGMRAYLQRHANDQGVKGYVRNLPNGEVLVVLEGEEFRVQFVVDRCVSGPPAATVEKAHVDWSLAKNEFEAFQIRP
jgi:acylphosphatase